MKRASFVALLLVLGVSSAWAQGAKPNFSGTWQLDPAKSEFGPMPPPTSMVTTIEHKDPKVVIKSAQKSDQGDVVNERTITTDGKPNINKLKTQMGDQDVTSTTNWSGNQLVTEFKMEINGTGTRVSRHLLAVARRQDADRHARHQVGAGSARDEDGIQQAVGSLPRLSAPGRRVRLWPA